MHGCNWCVPGMWPVSSFVKQQPSGGSWSPLPKKSLRQEESRDHVDLKVVDARGSHGEEFSSVQFSHSVMFDSLQPHWLQHARLPCPSPTPRACSNSCPSSWWCHPTISSSVIPFSSCFQSFPASGSFPVSQFFAPGGQSIGVSAFSISPSNEYSGLIFFRIDWFNLLEHQFPHLQGPETLEKMWPPIDLWAGPGQWEASPSLPYPRNVCSVYCSYNWNCFQGCILDRIEQCGAENNWTECVTETVMVSTQSYEIMAVGAKICCLSVPKTSLTSKFPFLFNPLSTSMDCSASFFSNFLPSMHRGQYENQHGTR